MPYRRRAPARRVRKPAVRRARRGRYSKTGGKITALKTATVPDRLVLKMKYVDNFQLIGAGGASRVFRLNSIYDPDTSVVNGHQPLGYDQWNTFYQKYRVFKAIVTLKAINAGVDTTASQQFGMCAITANAFL